MESENNSNELDKVSQQELSGKNFEFEDNNEVEEYQENFKEVTEDDEEDEDEDEDDEDDEEDEFDEGDDKVAIDLSENPVYRGMCTLLEDDEGNNLLEYISLLHSELIGHNKTMKGIKKDLGRIANAAELLLKKNVN